MKKIILYAFCLLLTAACGKDKTSQVKDTTTLPKATAPAKEGTQQKQVGAIAYVEIDSLATQYQFCIDQQKILEEKHKGYQQKLSNEGSAVAKAEEAFNKKLQSGQFKSEESAKSEYSSIQRQQQTFQSHQSQYENEFTTATANYQKELRKRLNEQLKAMNKDGRFALILTNSEQLMNVLYADSALDITKEVIDGLNAAYKK